jgi:hypothetical protein
MGNCKNKRLIGPFLDGQLGECKWLEEHIAECSECLAEYEMVQRLSYLADKADYPPPESSYWKKFGTRVIARIAARPQPKRYPRILEAIFHNRMAVRLVTPLLAVLIAVLAINLYAPLKQLREDPAMQIQAADEIKFYIGEIATVPEADRVSQPAPPIVEIAAVIESEPVMQTADDAIAAMPEADSDQTVAELPPVSGDDLVGDYLHNRQLKTSFAGMSNISNGLWADLTQNVRFRVFDTDQVMRFQILTGSNPSLAPLASYREAAERFFGPELSNSRNVFRQDLSDRWGYGSGDDSFNEERQRHLSLEFDLLKEK